jgi:hypothetical protein
MLEITEFNHIGDDERGFTKSFSVKDYREFIYLTRKANTLSGNSYHKGLNEGTIEKVFVLLNGSITLKYRAVGSDDIFIKSIDKPSVIKIKPYVVHNIFAHSDITMLENNSIGDIKSDIVRENVDK